MKVSAFNSVLLSALIVALGACSSSSDPSPADSGSDGLPSIPNGQLGDEPGVTPVDTPDEPGTETPIDTPDEPGTETPLDNPDQLPGGSDIPEPEPNGSTDPDMLIPNVIDGSNLDRLLIGINNQASRTILDLGRLLSEGAQLSDQQNDCLGAYDPALGESLLSVSCERALATGDIALYVGDAAFYDTSACNTSVFEGNTDDCQLQRASITIRTEWISAQPSQPPQPVAGIQIYYAIDNTILRIENTPDMLTGAFRCDIELSNGQTNTPITGQSCEDIIASAADRIETLLAN